MKLDELLGAELYAQVKAKLDEVNGNEPDKLKHIRYADLSEGEYVDKGKFAALQTKYDTQTQELTSANALITELKAGTAGNEGLQTKITEYEGQVQQLQAELEKTKLDNAIQLALRDAGVSDPDYMAYKLREKYGTELKLDDDGKVRGMDDKLSGLKTQYPNMFASGNDGGNGGYQVFDPNKLKKGEGGDHVPTKEEFRAMNYEQRVALKQRDEELYKKLSK